MAEVIEDEQNVYDTPEGPVVEEKKTIKADLDTFAKIMFVGLLIMGVTVSINWLVWAVLIIILKMEILILNC